MQQHANAHDGAQGRKPAVGKAAYRKLALMVLLSFVAMYVLMYAMVDRFDNVHHNLNQAYMAALMAAPMLVIELLLMGSMYPDRKLNAILIATGLAVAIACWMLIRQQAGIGDQQFLRSMIPHHAGAVLMCQRNRLRDPELRALCEDILASQQAEIELMKGKLR